MNPLVPQAKKIPEPRQECSTAESVAVVLACRSTHAAQEASEHFVGSILGRVSLLLLCLFCLSSPMSRLNHRSTSHQLSRNSV